MIKQLISDIAHEVIGLSTALTRAKIIAVKTGSDVFRNWLKQESEGYDREDEVPEYRKAPCNISLTVDYGYGRVQTAPLVITGNKEPSKPYVDLFRHHRMYEPIAVIERHLFRLKDSAEAEIELSTQQIQLIEKFFPDNTNTIKSGSIQIATASLEKIVQITKQKLLDTLLDLDNQFPNLENDYAMNSQDKEKAHNVITNNIYGDNNPVNVAAGHNVTQRDIHNNISQDYRELKDLGVDDKEIEDLKNILASHKDDKPSLMSKAFKWIAGVAATVTAKGLAEHIPAITNYVHHLIQ